MFTQYTNQLLSIILCSTLVNFYLLVILYGELLLNKAAICVVEQVVETILRAGYSRATHRNKMEGTPGKERLFCSIIIWQLKETEEERRKRNIFNFQFQQKCW
jgi:hypothetical protein